MADLYQVYGGLSGLGGGDGGMGGMGGMGGREEFSNEEEHVPAPQPPRKQKQARPQHQKDAEVPSMSAGNNKEQFQNMYNQEYATPQPVYRRDYSFWDKMSMKRGDIIKLIVFALIIVLGISIDRITTHYLTKYISDNILTDFQEFMLRLSYPVVVILVLWIIKSL
jgi:hypothetical protein